VASEGTRFGVNGVNIGLFCSTPMVALTRKIAPSTAFELLMTGAFIDAERARTLGLVNKVVAAENLSTQTRILAETIAGKLAKATRLGKAAFYPQLTMTTAQAYAFTAEVMVDNMMNPDTDEGINAFIEKRAPGWTQS
jgi:enoyl-CoA hydratase/carnithine racemase